MSRMMMLFLFWLNKNSPVSQKAVKWKNGLPKYAVYSVGMALSFVPWVITNQRQLWTFFRMLFSYNKRGGAKATWFPAVDVVLTTRCSLRCKYCSNLMQYYEHPYDVPLDVIKQSFDRMMSLIDYVDVIAPIGGETFLCKNLPEVLDYMLQYKQIGQIRINTNGTIAIRDERLLSVLRNKRILVNVSDYGYGNVEGFCATLKENQIAFSLDDSKNWRDAGNMKRRNRTDEEVNRQFQHCLLGCTSLLNGKFYLCPRGAHGEDLGLVPVKEGDCLDFSGDVNSVTRQDLVSYYYRETPIEACHYCDTGTPGMNRSVPAGREQLSKPLVD